MACSRGTVGTVLGVRETMKVEWIIPQFSELPAKVDEFYDSTVFAFLDALWRLRIYPGGQAGHHSEGYIGLYLVLLDKNFQQTVDYTFGFGDAGETKHEEIVFNRTFSKDVRGFGQPKFLARSELVKRKAELIPGDIFTAVATLSVAQGRLVKASLFERLRRLSYNMMDILKSKEHVDVRLKVDGKEIAAHACVLAARSEVFQKMLNHDMLERRAGEIKIEDIDEDVFGDIVIYTYGGRARVTAANARPLYVAADRYDLRGLRDLCSAYMEEHMSDDLFCDAYAVAETYGEKELMRVCTGHLEKHAQSILETEKWKKFSCENMHMAFKILSTFVRMNVGSSAK